MRDVVLPLVLIAIFTVSIFSPMPSEDIAEVAEGLSPEADDPDVMSGEQNILVLKVRFANQLHDTDRWSKEELSTLFNDDLNDYYKMASHEHISIAADVCEVELTDVKGGYGDVNSQDNLFLWDSGWEHASSQVLWAALHKVEMDADCLSSDSRMGEVDFDKYTAIHQGEEVHRVFMVLNGPDCRAAMRTAIYGTLDYSPLYKTDKSDNPKFRYAFICEATGTKGALGFDEGDIDAVAATLSDPPTNYFQVVKDDDGKDKLEWVGSPSATPPYSDYRTKKGYDDSKILGTIAHEFGHILGLSHTTKNYGNPFSLLSGSRPGQLTSYSMLDPDVNWLSPDDMKEIDFPEVGHIPEIYEINLFFLEDWDHSDDDEGAIRSVKIPLRNSYLIPDGDEYLPVATEYLLIEARTWDLSGSPNDEKNENTTSASDYWHCKTHDGTYQYQQQDGCTEYHQYPGHPSGNTGFYSIPDEGVLISRIDLFNSSGVYHQGQDAQAVNPIDTTPDDKTSQLASLKTDALLDPGDPIWDITINNKEVSVEVKGEYSVGGKVVGYQIKITVEKLGPGEAILMVPNTMDEEDGLLHPPWTHPELWVDSGYNGFCPIVDSSAGISSGVEIDDTCLDSLMTGSDQIGGDTPMLGVENRICFTVRNVGESAWTDDDDGPAELKFLWKTSNMGIPSTGYEMAGEVAIPSINSNEEKHVCIDGWVPEYEGDTEEDSGLITAKSCIQVQYKLDGELVGALQENFNQWKTTQSSPYHPIEHSFEVHNPFDNQTYIWIEVDGLDPGWTYELGWEGENISGHESEMNTIIVTPPQDTEFSSSSFVQLDPVRVSIRQFTMVFASEEEMLVREIGGIEMEIVPSQKSTMTHTVPDTVVQVGEPMTVTGVVMNGIPGSMVTALLTAPSGELHIKATPLGSSGEFTISTNPYRLSNETGVWSVQMFYHGAQAVAGSSTGKTTFEVLPRNIRETQTIDVDTIFEIRGSVDPDIGVSDNRMQITYTSPAGEITTRETLIQGNGDYSDDFELNAGGEWRIDYSYVDGNGTTVQFSQSVDVLEVDEDGVSSSSLALSLLAIAALCGLIAIAVKGRR